MTSSWYKLVKMNSKKTFSVFKTIWRSYNKKLTHVNEKGDAKMVDVGWKADTRRTAQAQAIVYVSKEIATQIKVNQMKKGDVLKISQLAGIMGAKQTSQLIPLCHNINLSSINVEAKLNEEASCVTITADVCCTGKTGVEMEALTAVSVAALTVYDMCKAVSKDMTISEVKLLKKTGGKSDYVS